MAEFSIKGVIEILLRGKGGEEAAQVLRALEDEAKKARTDLEATAAASQKLSGAVEGTGAASSAAAPKVDELATAGKGAAAAEREAGQAAASAAQETAAAVAPTTGLTEATERLGDSAERVRTSGEGAARPLAESLGEATPAAMSLDDAIRELNERGLTYLARETAANRDLIEGFSASLVDAGDATEAEVTPAFLELLAVTRNVPAALAGVKIASQLAQEAGIPLANAQRALALIISGKVIPAAQLLGIAVRDASGKMREQSAILGDLQARYGDLAKRARDGRTAVNEFAKAQKQATGVTAEAAKATGGLGTSFRGIGTSIKSLLGAAGIVLSVSAALRKLKEAVTDLATEKRSFEALKLQLRALGVEGGPPLEQIRQKLLAIGRDGGPAIAETLPVFQKLVTITEDTAAALALTELAARANETTLLTTAEAGEALTDIMQGRLLGAATKLGIKFEEGTTRAEALEAAFRLFPESVNDINDTQEALDRTGSAARDLGRDIAQELDPAIRAFSSTIIPGAVKSLRVFFAMFRTGVNEIITGVMGAGKVFAANFDLRTLATSGPKAYFDKITAAAHEAVQDMKDVYQDGADDISNILVAGAVASGKEEADARAAAIAAARAKDEKDRVEAARKTEIAVLQARLEVATEGSAEQLDMQRRVLALQRDQAIAEAEKTGQERGEIEARFLTERQVLEEQHARKVAEIERQSQRDLLQARIESLKEGTEERNRLELELLAIERDSAIVSARETGRAVEDIQKEYRQRELNLIEQHEERKRQRAAEAAQETLRAQVAAAEEGSKLRLDLELELLDRETEESIRRAEQEERDITAIRLAAALERYQKTQKYVDAENARRRAQASDLRDAEAAAQQATLELQLAQLKDGSLQRFAIEKELVEQKRALDIETIEAERDLELERIDERIDSAEQQIDLYKEIAVSRLEAEGASEEEIAEAVEGFEQRKAEVRAKGEDDKKKVVQTSNKKVEAVEKGAAAATIQIAKASQKAKEGSYLAAAASIIGSLQSIFGENKAAAAAEAVINTYEGVSLALATYPWPYSGVVAALVAAQGFATVRKILSTSIGSSGSGGGSGGGGGGASVAAGRDKGDGSGGKNKSGGKDGNKDGGGVKHGTTAAGTTFYRATGGAVARASHGSSGLLSGPGGPEEDRIAVLTEAGEPVRLSRGEYVVQEKAVRRYGAKFLDRVNSGLLDPKTARMASGGELGRAIAAAARMVRGAPEAAAALGMGSGETGAAMARSAIAASLGAAARGAEQRTAPVVQHVTHNNNYDQRDQREEIGVTVRGIMVTSGKTADLRQAVRKIEKVRRADACTRPIK